MKNNNDLLATLNTVIARLDRDPRSALEWRVIASALRVALRHAVRTADGYMDAEERRNNLGESPDY